MIELHFCPLPSNIRAGIWDLQDQLKKAEKLCEARSSSSGGTSVRRGGTTAASTSTSPFASVHIVLSAIENECAETMRMGAENSATAALKEASAILSDAAAEVARSLTRDQRDAAPVAARVVRAAAVLGQCSASRRPPLAPFPALRFHSDSRNFRVTARIVEWSQEVPVSVATELVGTVFAETERIFFCNSAVVSEARRAPADRLGSFRLEAPLDRLVQRTRRRRSVEDDALRLMVMLCSVPEDASKVVDCLRSLRSAYVELVVSFEQMSPNRETTKFLRDLERELPHFVDVFTM